jgi:hypothetical protein
MSSCLGARGLAGEVTSPGRVISLRPAVEPEFGAASEPGGAESEPFTGQSGVAAPEQAAL